MNYSVAKFDVTKWEVDKAYLKIGLNPEVGYFDIDVDQIEDYQPVGGLGIKNKEMALAGVRWIFTILTKATRKEIVRLELEAEYFIPVSQLDNLKDIIQESHRRFSSIYAQKSAEAGFPDVLPNLEQSVCDQICRDIIKLLK